MDKVTNEDIRRAQGVSEPLGPVGIASGFPGSTRRLSGYWKNDGGEVESQAPRCTVTATGAKANSKRLAVSREKPRMVSDVRISDNATISVAPRTRGDEEGDPFKPSRKIQRSPTIGGRPGRIGGLRRDEGQRSWYACDYERNGLC